MRIASESIIHSVYEDLQQAVGSERFCELVHGLFAEDFVYTDPAVVLLGRDAFITAVRRLRTIRAVDRFHITVRDLGSHAVATGACVLSRRDGTIPAAYVFNAMWRRVGGGWLCVAQRGASALMSERPAGR